jgi:hypothetical protein
MIAEELILWIVYQRTYGIWYGVGEAGSRKGTPISMSWLT